QTCCRCMASLRRRFSRRSILPCQSYRWTRTSTNTTQESAPPSSWHLDATPKKQPPARTRKPEASRVRLRSNLYRVQEVRHDQPLRCEVIRRQGSKIESRC